MMSSARRALLASLSFFAIFVSVPGKTAEPTFALLPVDATLALLQPEPVALLQGETALDQTEQCPFPAVQPSAEEKKAQMRKNPKAFNNVRALVGVDVLGRAVVGIDSDRDGFVNLAFMFTDTVRLEGPWSAILEHASVFLNDGSAKVESHDLTVGMVFALNGAVTPKLTPRKYKRVLIREEGWALTKSQAFVESQAYVELKSLDVNSVYTWPLTFQEDLLQPPGTFDPSCNCLHTICHAGGCGATQCSLGTCSTTCSSGFACCRDYGLYGFVCTCKAYSASCFQ